MENNSSFNNLSSDPFQGSNPNFSSSDKSSAGEGIARFFKEDLKNMFVSLFKYPASGAQ